jgi:hypothetical protein
MLTTQKMNLKSINSMDEKMHDVMLLYMKFVLMVSSTAFSVPDPISLLSQDLKTTMIG